MGGGERRRKGWGWNQAILPPNLFWFTCSLFAPVLLYCGEVRPLEGSLQEAL